MKPQDLRNANTAGRAVAAGVRQDWKQDFAQTPELALPNWQFVDPAKNAIQHLASYVERVATTTLEDASDTLGSIADSYEHADTKAAVSLGAAPEGQG
ncbi:hypothetical protein ACFXPX_04400 [Kitasatospora sp. NPDC059146]|uniref:hypothetical protein n=1 Tax=Kitasatospora sp. NPDC059146 TaxID=3346741 RepID=UPI0036CF500F